jgi:hypothetical protein
VARTKREKAKDVYGGTRVEAESFTPSPLHHRRIERELSELSERLDSLEERKSDDGADARRRLQALEDENRDMKLLITAKSLAAEIRDFILKVTHHQIATRENVALASNMTSAAEGLDAYYMSLMSKWMK